MKEKKKKRLSINGISIQRILAYFTIYSVVGFILETIFALVVYGKIESRQGFLYGPVCPIYGVGAVVLIVAFQKIKKNGYALFLGGIVMGSIVEYIVSLIGECIFNARWWDYSGKFLNINGRICLLYSIYWGIVTLLLMKAINPGIDKAIEWIKSKIKIKTLKCINTTLFILMLIDFAISGLIVHVFLSRTVVENNISVVSRAVYDNTYNNIYKNKHVEKLMTNVWNEKFIVKIYPNLKLRLKDGGDVMVQNYYKHVQPYYYKFN